MMKKNNFYKSIKALLNASKQNSTVISEKKTHKEKKEKIKEFVVKI